MDQHREREVLPPFRLPAVRATALPCRLVIGHNHHRTLAVRLQPTVRRVRFIDMNDVKYHIRLQRYKIICNFAP